MRWAPLLPVALASLLAGARPVAQTPAFAARVNRDVALRIHNLVGETRVTAWDLDSLEAVVAIPKGGGRFYGGGRDAGVKLGIEGQDPSFAGPGATLEVKVPRGARVWIKSGTARVEVAAVGGEVEVSSVTGPVTVAGAPRVVTVESIDGDVTVTGAATVVRVRTGAGAARIHGARGDVVASTVQGPLTVVSPEVLSARLESVSGVVEVRTGMALDGRLEVETHDGNVGLWLPASIDARFDLTTVKGSIVSRLTGRAHSSGKDRTLQFSVGKKAGLGRGAAVTVRTFSGEIRIDSNR